MGDPPSRSAGTDHGATFERAGVQHGSVVDVQLLALNDFHGTLEPSGFTSLVALPPARNRIDAQP